MISDWWRRALAWEGDAPERPNRFQQGGCCSGAGQDPGNGIEVSPVLLTQEQLNKNNVKTIVDLDAKLPGFGHSDQATASWMSAAEVANTK